jgi:2Fe-2S ferredoxin
MPTITYIEPGGRAITLDADAGMTLMRAAMDAELEGIEAHCGGVCACATCHCYVLEGLDKLRPPTEDERIMLSNVAGEQRPNSRLSCQLVVEPLLEGLTVAFPDRQS